MKQGMRDDGVRKEERKHDMMIGDRGKSWAVSKIAQIQAFPKKAVRTRVEQ